MPSRLYVPPPDQNEEVRQLAEVVADLHHVQSLIIENSKEFLPGEAIDELNQAWEKSQESMQTLVRRLTPTSPPSTDYPPISYQDLAAGELTGEVGRIKKSSFRRFMDRFLMFFNSEPRTAEKRLEASEAASEVLELGETMVSSIPGYHHVVETISVVKQLVGLRRKRGV